MYERERGGVHNVKNILRIWYYHLMMTLLSAATRVLKSSEHQASIQEDSPKDISQLKFLEIRKIHIPLYSFKILFIRLYNIQLH